MDEDEDTKPNQLGEWYDGFVTGRFAERADLVRGLSLVLGRQAWTPEDIDAFVEAVQAAAKENR